MRPLTFLSDYGTDDEFVGVVHAVIARLAPEARVIDLGHGIPRHGVLQGALTLARTLPYAPAGVHLAVVDPEVGARRRAVALRTAHEDRLLVGPDNGLLLPAAERFGGIAEVVEISASPWRLEPVSATFHGRDVFAPVAAKLALGAPLADAGEAIPPDSLVTGKVTEPAISAGRVGAHVLYVDRFGNAALDVDAARLPETGLRLGRRLWVAAGGVTLDAVYSLTFADVAPGELILYQDSYDRLALAVNRGSAAERLAVRPGDDVVLRTA